MNKLVDTIQNPLKLFLYFGRKGFFNCINSKTYLRILFKLHFGYYPDLDNPKTYNEKLQWLKLNYYNSRYCSLADKFLVRNHVKELIGEKYLIPLLWSGDNFKDIDFNVLPDRFVMKCAHDSGSVIVCNDRSKLDIKKAQKFIEKHQKINLYWAGREWPYKDLKPRIIIEENIGTEIAYPEDYKFYVFNGKIDCVMVCKGREAGYPNFYFYDTEWNRLSYLKDEPYGDAPCPANFAEMLNLVKILSNGIPAVRIDLYNVNEHIYFGEYTFFNQSGFDLDITRATDEHWGDLFELSAFSGEENE